MIYNIISTGSKGNAVIINDNILIDCGVPYKALKPYVKDIKLVLLTHIHGDHFNPATIKKLHSDRPTVRFGCCDWLINLLLDCGVNKRNIDPYSNGGIFEYKNLCKITPQNIPHNVPNCAYHIQIDNFKIFYATDTNDLSHVSALNYNLYFVEGNYTESDILERIRQKQEIGAFCYEYEVLNNHLSVEKATEWLFENARNKSEYVLLHGHESEKGVKPLDE